MKTVLNLSVLLESFSYEEALKVMKDAGFDGVDLSLCKTSSIEYFLDEDYLQKAEAFKKQAEDLGLAILQAHAPFNGTIEYGEDKFHLTQRSVEVAGLCGADCIVVHPIQYLPYFDDPKNREILFDYNMEFYGRLAPLAEKYGIKIATENMWRTNKKRGIIDHSVNSRSEEFCRYIENLQTRYGDLFTACLDLGHAGLVGEDPAQMIRALGPYLGALHIHDNDYVKDLHLIPGHGQMDWNAIHQALKEVGYQGHYTLECTAYPFDQEMARMYAEYLGKVSRHYAAILAK